jgi:hypothetical protein
MSPVWRPLPTEIGLKKWKAKLSTFDRSMAGLAVLRPFAEAVDQCDLLDECIGRANSDRDRENKSTSRGWHRWCTNETPGTV